MERTFHNIQICIHFSLIFFYLAFQIIFRKNLFWQKFREIYHNINFGSFPPANAFPQSNFVDNCRKYCTKEAVILERLDMSQIHLVHKKLLSN